MTSRTVLIQGYAKKNKSRRNKYFVVSIGFDYASPCMDYFTSQDKWLTKKHEILDPSNNTDSSTTVPQNKDENNINTMKSHGKCISLENLFFVDEFHKSKFKQLGVDLFMPECHLSLTFANIELRKKWQGILENIQYKNSKSQNFPKIEYAMEASVRIKTKESIEKCVLTHLKGAFRICLMKRSMILVNKSLTEPAITLQYPFLREWESRYDGSLRIEVGRASLIGECFLVIQLSDYEEAKNAHEKLRELIKCFKLAKPEAPKIRKSESSAGRRNFSTYSRHSSQISETSLPLFSKSDSYNTFRFDPLATRTQGLDSPIRESLTSTETYVPMNCADFKKPAGDGVQECSSLRHTKQLYRCRFCGMFTRVVTFCAACSGVSSERCLTLLSQLEPGALSQTICPPRGKTRSLVERPRTVNAGLFRPLTITPVITSSTSSFLGRSSGSALSTDSSICSFSQQMQQQHSAVPPSTSTSSSSNRHDNDIFMDIDFDNLQLYTQQQQQPPLGYTQTSAAACHRHASSLSFTRRSSNSSDKSSAVAVRCGNCCGTLSPEDSISNNQSGSWRQSQQQQPQHGSLSAFCDSCDQQLAVMFFLIPSEPPSVSATETEWRPRTTSLVPLRQGRIFRQEDVESTSNLRTSVPVTVPGIKCSCVLSSTDPKSEYVMAGVRGDIPITEPPHQSAMSGVQSSLYRCVDKSCS